MSLYITTNSSFVSLELRVLFVVQVFSLKVQCREMQLAFTFNMLHWHLAFALAFGGRWAVYAASPGHPFFHCTRPPSPCNEVAGGVRGYETPSRRDSVESRWAGPDPSVLRWGRWFSRSLLVWRPSGGLPLGSPFGGPFWSLMVSWRGFCFDTVSLRGWPAGGPPQLLSGVAAGLF